MPSQYQTKKDRAKVLPGFPWEGTFKTKEDVDKYFSGDKIQCLLCGKWYKWLSPGHLGLHDLTVDEYKEKYGLPFRRGLTCCCLRDKKSDGGQQRFADGKMNYCFDALRAGRKIMKETNPSRRNKQPYQIDMAIKRAVGIYGKEKPWGKKDFDKILYRMKTQKRILKSVYSDPDLPGYNAWRDWIKKYPEYKNTANEIHDSFPYPLQATGNKMGLRFVADCLFWSRHGMNPYEIADLLGVGQMTVWRALNNFRHERRTK